MTIPPGTPRRRVESDPLAALMADLRAVADRVASLERGASLRNASISGGEGLRVIDTAGGTRISLNTTDGAVVAYDANGDPVARFGPLANSNPGQYGVEVLYNGSWVQVGAGNVDWGNISNKPATYAPSAHGHSGGDITGTVPSATTATYAVGSSQAYNNNVGGTSYYAVWVGNDTGNKLGRNTSSARYKTNIRRHDTSSDGVLALQPVVYDRHDRLVYPEDPDTGQRLIGPPNMIRGTKGEYGLIAEQVAEHVPEIVQWYGGEIDGIRYDLLSVALLDVVKDQEARIKALEAHIAQRIPTFTPPARSGLSPHAPAAAAPATAPPPTPYEILPPEGATV